MESKQQTIFARRKNDATLRSWNCYPAQNAENQQMLTCYLQNFTPYCGSQFRMFSKPIILHLQQIKMCWRKYFMLKIYKIKLVDVLDFIVL